MYQIERRLGVWRITSVECPERNKILLGSMSNSAGSRFGLMIVFLAEASMVADLAVGSIVALAGVGSVIFSLDTTPRELDHPL
jgi:uncharacterized membrane protein